MGMIANTKNRTMIAKARGNGARAWNGNRAPIVQHASRRARQKEMVTEIYGGEPYEFYPLGEYIVAAPSVCRGRPTFKYTRVEVIPILEAMAGGWSVKDVVTFYQRPEIPTSAVREAVRLANSAFVQSVSARVAAT